MAEEPILPKITPTYHHDPYPTISPLRPELSTAGKSVVITGAAGSIGSAIAKAYVQSGTTNLFLLDLNADGLTIIKESLSNTGDTNLYTIALDITNPDLVKETFEQIEARIGKVDILINNAGYQNSPIPALEVDIDVWFRNFEINVKGSFLVAREFLRHAVPEAVVVNMSSCMAHHGLRHQYCNGHSGYCASKIAITKIMEILQEELPLTRIFNIHPGLIWTPLSHTAGSNPGISRDSGKSLCSTEGHSTIC